MTEIVSHSKSDEAESDEDAEFLRSFRSKTEDLVEDPWQSRKSGSWLGEQLFNACIRGRQPDDAFLPSYKLKEILTEETVRKELRDSSVDFSEANLTRIVEGVCRLHKSDPSSGKPRVVAFRKIFAILVLIGEAPAIINFIEQNVSDSHLPLTIKLSKGGAQTFRGSDPNLLLSCFERWNSDAIELFNNFQWWMVLPFLNNKRKVFRYQLDPWLLVTNAESPTPRTWYRSIEGEDMSRCVRLLDEEDNCSLENSLGAKELFALKEFLPMENLLFEREVANLTLLNQIQHPHIISLLASFNSDDWQYLLFPWADGGSLRSLWERHDNPELLGKELAVWIIQECQGIASALACIHYPRLDVDKPRDSRTQELQFYGRHSGLHPESVVWFRENSKTHKLGVLKIAGFDATRFSTTCQARPICLQKNVLGHYCAPELDDDGRGVISQVYDIWTLGCLYLDFLTWYLMGWKGFLSFVQTRRSTGRIGAGTFFRFEMNDLDKHWDERTKIMNPEVTKWIADLHKHPRSTLVIHDFLNLVETSMLKINVKDRAQSSEVASRLERLLERCRETPLYATEARPWTETGYSSSLLGQDVRMSSQYLPDSIKDLRLIPCGSVSMPSSFDKWRIRLENWLGHGEIDWYPLPPVNRLQSPTQAKLAWRYGSRELWILLSEDQTSRCRGRIREVAQDQPILPIATSGETGTRHNTWTSTVWGLANLSQRWARKTQKAHGKDKQQDDSIGKRDIQPPSAQDEEWKEFYSCYDKAWMAMRRPRLTTISVDGMPDDRQFFLDVKEVHEPQERWLQRLVSWKSVNKIELSLFYFLFADSDLVLAVAPEPNQDLCPGYNWKVDSKLRDVYMKVIEAIMIEGLQAPDLGRGAMTVLDGIPTRRAPPALERKPWRFAWGFHIRQGPSGWRIMCWAIGFLALGVAFVPIWLGAIDKLDLQNAFTPLSIIIALIVLRLSVMFLGNEL